MRQGGTRWRLFLVLRYERVHTWLLNHPSRLTWILIELVCRPLPFRQRFSNAWWQLRHYGDVEAFDALWQTWNRSCDAEAKRA